MKGDSGSPAPVQAVSGTEVAHHAAISPAGRAQGLGPAEGLIVLEEQWCRVKEF